MSVAEIKPIRLWARLAPDVAAKLDRYAEHQGASRARLLREIIESWLSEKPDEPEGDPIVQDRAYDQSAYMRRRIDQRELRDVQDASIRTGRILLTLRDQVTAMAGMVDEAMDCAARGERML